MIFEALDPTIVLNPSFTKTDDSGPSIHMNRLIGREGEKVPCLEASNTSQKYRIPLTTASNIQKKCIPEIRTSILLRFSLLSRYL